MREVGPAFEASRTMRVVAMVLLMGCGPLAENHASLRQPLPGAPAGGPLFAVPMYLGATTPDVHCTGALVAPRTVLTAGHCLDGRAPNTLWVSVAGANATRTPAVRVVTHPSFSPRAAFDVGVVELASALDAGVLPHFGGAPPAQVTAVGWGDGVRRSLGATLSVLEANTALISTDGGHACNGDSGGPVYDARQSPGDVVAVISRGDASCTADTTVARVDVVRDWVRRTSAEWEGASCEVDGLCRADCATPDLDCGCLADGQCAATCRAPASDPDCAADCGVDGVCSAGPCPTEDTDCVADGDACGTASQCRHRRCSSTATGLTPVCTKTCAADVDCAAGQRCGLRGLCEVAPVVAEPEPPARSAGCSVVPSPCWLLVLLWASRRALATPGSHRRS